MKVHFIAIGGAAMHNMAIALKRKGFHVSGSDDEIFDPSKSRLEKEGLLPVKYGWFPDKITTDLDAIILGMHARSDNPELAKAKDLGIKIYSYPEYLYEQSIDKIRVVIGGSHGKTSITAMILHALNYHNIENDYLVGAQLAGFDCMVKLSDAKIIVIEGDEYLSSPIDRRPKFHWYKPQIALLSGIAWDHINVFPTFENYVNQFEVFANSILPGGDLVYYNGDENLNRIADEPEGITLSPYAEHPHEINNGTSLLITENAKIPLKIFGKHNLQNLNGARLVCEKLGMKSEDFYLAIKDFKGAAKRLETLVATDSFNIFKDFAHSPSKLKASTDAVKYQWKDRKLIACMELHTFSSLNVDFLEEYKGSMNSADVAIVYFDPKVVQHKKLKEISSEQVKSSFGLKHLEVFTDKVKLRERIENLSLKNSNLLLMSSGNFAGIEMNQFANDLAAKYDLTV